MTNWNLQTASGKGITWAEVTSTWALTTQTWAELGSTAWSDATKNTSTWRLDELEAGAGYLYNDLLRNYNVLGTLYNYEDEPTSWTEQVKS